MYWTMRQFIVILLCNAFSGDIRFMSMKTDQFIILKLLIKRISCLYLVSYPTFSIIPQSPLQDVVLLRTFQKV